VKRNLLFFEEPSPSVSKHSVTHSLHNKTTSVPGSIKCDPEYDYPEEESQRTEKKESVAEDLVEGSKEESCVET
jgi:hypothetical protein